MRRLTKKVISFMLVLMLSVCGALGYSLPVHAEGEPTVYVTPLVTNSYSEQAFEVYVSVEGAQYTSNAGSGNLSAGSNTLSFATSDVVNLQVVAPYTVNGTGTAYYTVYATSINAYYVTASCVTDGGQVLDSQTITLSKYNQPEVVYNAPASIDGGDTVYVTSNPSLVFKYGDGSKSITYTAQKKGDLNYTVNYVDENDTILYTENNVLKYGETAQLTAPATYEANGNTYALKTTNAFDLDYTNVQSTYTFEYVKQIPAPETPYEITVNLKDDAGNLLYSFRQGLDVGGSVNVELPNTYEINFKKYQLAEGEPTHIVRDFASTDATEYNVTYVLADESVPYDITINLVDYETGKILSAVTGQVTPEGEAYVYDISTSNALTINDTVYQVMSGQGNEAGQIVHTYGNSTRVYSVYYTSKQVENPESYPVTMRYICVNDNKVLDTLTQDVEFNSSVTFEEAPATITVEGKEYTRLNGQEGEVVHNYNTSNSNYTVFYRDASVKLESEEEPEVIIQTVTQYIEREDGTVETNQDGTTVPEQVEIATVTTESGEEVTYDNATGEQVEIEDGRIVTLEDEEVPLANAQVDIEETSSESEPQEKGMGSMPMILGIIVIIILVVVFLLKKKKN